MMTAAAMDAGIVGIRGIERHGPEQDARCAARNESACLVLYDFIG